MTACHDSSLCGECTQTRTTRWSNLTATVGVAAVAARSPTTVAHLGCWSGHWRSGGNIGWFDIPPTTVVPQSGSIAYPLLGVRSLDRMPPPALGPAVERHGHRTEVATTCPRGHHKGRLDTVISRA